jgi:hypothetical protein
MIAELLALVLAAGMFAVGSWGRRNADTLVPKTLSAYGRARKAQQMRRNGRIIQVSAVVLVALAAYHLVTNATSLT